MNFENQGQLQKKLLLKNVENLSNMRFKTTILTRFQFKIEDIEEIRIRQMKKRIKLKAGSNNRIISFYRSINPLWRDRVNGNQLIIKRVRVQGL